MQTRAQKAAAAAAVQQAANASPPPPTNTNDTIQPAFSLGSLSSLSTLTPTSSFVSDAETVQAGGFSFECHGAFESTSDGRPTSDDEHTSEDKDIVAPFTLHFNVPHRSLRTPAHSHTDRYPADVFEAPKKKLPTHAELRTAQWACSSAIAAGHGKLTRTGTLVPTDYQEYPETSGSGLLSAFGSPSLPHVQPLTNEQLEREATPRQNVRVRTRILNPRTGEYIG
ncbi:hypothetical protein C8R43DRAFT_474268 [Mycena crocata]|nr:hypothetical protein C8R43DRAFT_474268 [Mycena crocata]